MPYFERIRDRISGSRSERAPADLASNPLSQELLQQRTAAGWQLVALEWQRELPGAPGAAAPSEEIPYGLRISENCLRLEIDPAENEALTLMMDLLVQDFSYSHVVSALNEQGFRMRDGSLWNRVAVFNMHPRLTEIGPRLFRESSARRLRSA